MKESMLTSVDRELLADLLMHGDNVPSNISDNIERHPTSVSQRLSELEDMGLVRNKGRGVWTLTAPGANMARSLAEPGDNST
jgi:Mn-dependent DtxR family transcriptional regulator